MVAEAGAVRAVSIELSFVIPARNAGPDLERVLNAVKVHAEQFTHEVIVVDNESTDETQVVALNHGATVVPSSSNTISAVRNEGVLASSGQWLVFIDSDIELTARWGECMSGVLAQLIDNKRLLTGSRVLAVPDGRYLNRYWFSRLVEYEAKYINSGHLIIGRSFFDEIGGFDEALKTSEDYDLCKRANASGGVVQNATGLDVIHLGYPESLIEFTRRERWHGRQDFESLGSFFRSMMGLLAAANLIVFFASTLLTIVFQNPGLIFSYVSFVTALCLAFSYRRFGAADVLMLIGTASVFFFYIWGRSWALFYRLWEVVSGRSVDCSKH